MPVSRPDTKDLNLERYHAWTLNGRANGIQPVH
jgi:hypothetical protein